jgi:phytoene synthase
MSKNFEKDVFKKGSITYYLSSHFFPTKIRRDVYRLYSFVRVTDDYVDEEPRQPHKVAELEKRFQAAMGEQHFDPTTHAWDDTDIQVVKNIVRLTQRYKFDPAWVTAFLESMKQDLKPVANKKLDDTLKYVYGTSEVIGLMMAKIMKLPEEAWEAAKLQGRAMQWINMLRDIREDMGRDRQYFPDEDLKAVGLPALTEEAARENPEAYKKFIDLQLKRYRQWQKEATAAYSQIPQHYRIPLQTSRDMYKWTAEKIEKNPMIIWRKTVKPSKARVLAKGAKKVTVRKSKQLHVATKNKISEYRSK